MNIVPFNFESNQVRTLTDESGNAWFVLRDVLEASNSSTRPADAKAVLIEGLGDEVVSNYPILDSIGRTQEVTIVTESAVTYLIAQSRTEAGKKLNKWIHCEVIPSIRKTGGYAIKNTDLPFLVAQTKAAVELSNLYGITGNAALLSADTAINKLYKVSPMSILSITHLVSENQERYYTPTELGKQSGISAVKMNNLLCEAGLQTKVSGHWTMTSKGKSYGILLDTHKKSSEGTPVTQLKWLMSVVDLV